MYRSNCVLVLCVIFAHVKISLSDNMIYDCHVKSGLMEHFSHIGTDGKLDRTFKCFLTCLFEVHEIVKPDGTVNTNITMKALEDRPDRDKVNAAIESCNKKGLSLRSKDNCEVGFTVYHCWTHTGVFKEFYKVMSPSDSQTA